MSLSFRARPRTGHRQTPSGRSLIPLSLIVAAGLSACDAGGTTAPHYDEAPAAIQLSKASVELERGDTSRLQAVVLNASGSPIASPSAGSPLAAPVSWTSSDPSIVTVSRSGLVLAQREGQVTINARAGTLHSTSTVSVNSRGKGITVSPRVDTLQAPGHSLQMSVTVLNGSGRELANPNVTWTSSEPSVATISESGLVKAAAAGATLIIATAQGQSDTARIVVRQSATPPPPTVAVVEVTPGEAALEVGETQRFTATVRDGSGAVMPGVAVVWSSSDPEVATVDGAGVATAQSDGASVIRATAEGKSGSAPLTVKAPPSSPAPPPGAGDHPVPSSIDATGTKDVTRELLDFFASVPDGSRIVFAAGATYRIEGTLRIHNRHDLVFEGNGARFIADDPTPTEHARRNPDGSLRNNAWRNRYHWSIEGGRGIVIRNLSVRGANAGGGRGDGAYVASLEAQHGVNISGAEAVVIEDVDVSYVYGDFVYIGGATVGGQRVISRDVTVRGGIWSHNGRQGIGITNAEGVLVEKISMTETRRASIDLEPNTSNSLLRNVTIRDSYFGPGRLLWLAAGGSSGVMEDILLADNRLDRTMSVHIRPPEGSRRRNFRLYRNVSTREGGGGSRGIWNVWAVDGFDAAGNVSPVEARRNQAGLWLHDVTGVKAQEGQWPGANPQIHVEPIS